MNPQAANADGGDWEDDGFILDVSNKSHHGIALWPVPSEDPKDPLRWSRWLKMIAFLCACLCNFTANVSGAGPSSAIPLFIAEFRKTPNQVNDLLSYNFLLLGLGNLFWVPLAVKFGKRTILIGSMALLFASLIWAAESKSFNSLLASRCVSGFAAAAGESIVPAIVSDIFFLHERGSKMAIYVLLTSGGSAVGPLISGYMIQGAGSWRSFIWLSAALAGFNVIVLFLFYPESNFHRPTFEQIVNPVPSEEEKNMASHLEDGLKTTVEQEKEESLHNLYGAQSVKVSNPSWVETWTTFWTVDHDANFFKVLLHPIMFVTYPSILWAVFTYGVALSPQIILIFNFPTLLSPPPYSFATGEIGLMQVSAIIGFVIACLGGGWLSDVVTARRIIKANGMVYAEQRLISLLPGMVIGPAGCILIAFAGSRTLAWPALAVGFGMLSFGTVYTPNIAVTYVVDSYRRYAGESLVLINVVKNIVAFIFIYFAVDWIQSQGFLQVYMIMFALSCLSLLMAIPVFFYGKRWRMSASKSGRHVWFQ